MKKERQMKQFMSKFLNAASLFLLVFSMFSTPLVTIAETSEGTTPSTEAVQPESATEASSSATEASATEATSSATGALAPSGADRAAAPRAPKAVDDVITSIKYTNNEGGELNWSLEPWATFKDQRDLCLAK